MVRILVVEDEETMQELIQVVLEQAGHVVVKAHNGAEGFQHYQQEGADLVITDMRMPVMDGCQMILGLSRRFPAVKILAISGDQCALDQARALHVQGTLKKPFSSQELLLAVQQLMHSESSFPSQ